MSDDRLYTPKTPAAQQHGGPSFFLQRKCGCGATTDALSGECKDCRERRGLGLQPKLEIGDVDDRFERDADRVADEVTGSAFVSAAASRLRPLDAGSGGLGEAPPIVRQTLATPGAPLDQATRSYFEPRFGHDFSRVTVHADGRADASARAVGAHAYTVGDHIAFASGRFSPATQSGRQLIAHELAHVVQQSGTARLQRQAAAPPVRYSPAMQLDQALKELPNMPPADALAVLKRYQQYILQSITNGENRIRAHMALRAEGIVNYVIGGTIEVFGGATLPSDDWGDAWREVNAAYDTINAGQIKESLVRLNAASRATTRRWEELNEYFDRTDVGVDRSVTTLKGIVVVAAVVEVLLGAGVVIKAAKPLVLSLSLATAPVGTTGAAVAAPAVVAAAPTVAAGSAPVLISVGAPTVAAVAAPAAATTAAVAAPTVVAVTAPAVTSTATTTLAIATTLVASTTISSDTPAPQKKEEEEKKKKCPHPTGRTARDPIPIQWFKPRLDRFYPDVVEIPGHLYERDAGETELPHGEPFGVSEERWPYVGKQLQLKYWNRPGTAASDRYRRLLTNYGYRPRNLGLQVDHVQDPQWGIPNGDLAGHDLDDWFNLWPLDQRLNGSAGGRQNNTQTVNFCPDSNGAPRLNVSISQLKAESRYGLYFVIDRIDYSS